MASHFTPVAEEEIVRYIVIIHLSVCESTCKPAKKDITGCCLSPPKESNDCRKYFCVQKLVKVEDTGIYSGVVHVIIHISPLVNFSISEE